MAKPRTNETVTVEAVYVGNRLRDLDESVFSLLIPSIQENGLIHPIMVRMVPEMVIDGEESVNVPVLISGRHRLEAFRRLGRDRIDCVYMDVDEIDAEIIEIDENLARKDLSDGERGLHMKRRKALWEIKHPETKAGVAQAAGMNRALERGRQIGDHVDTTPPAERFTKTVAAITGRGERTIQREIQRAEKLGDDMGKIVGTSLDKGVELDALVQMPIEERKQIIDRAVSGETVSARQKPDTTAIQQDFRDWLATYVPPDQLATLATFIHELGAKRTIELIKEVGTPK